MSKIVQAVNAMISNPDNITKVIRGETEFFFIYRDKYKWSITRKPNGDHVLWFYPGEIPIETLATYEGPEFEGIDMVIYNDAEIGTQEARATFAELYTMLKERLFNVHKVLDDIISDSDLA